MDQISDKKNKEEAWVKNLVLDDALKLLDDRARQIIKLSFFRGQDTDRGGGGDKYLSGTGIKA